MSTTSTVTMSATLQYSDSSGFEETGQTPAAGITITPSGARCRHFTQTINTSDTALSIGDISSPGAVYIRNLDPTNYVDLRVAAAGSKFARLQPNGLPFVGYLGPDAAVPVGIANSGACVIEILIVTQ